MRRCYSRVKVSYGMQNLSIQQERYDNIFIALTEVANIVVDDEKSYKIILDWIEKAMKNLLKQIQGESVEKIVDGEVSCSNKQQIHCGCVEKTITGKVSCRSNNVEIVMNDPVMTRHKDRPLYLRKEASILKKYAQKNKAA